MWLDNKIKEVLENITGGGNYLAVEIGNSHVTVAEFSKGNGGDNKILSIHSVDLPYSSDDGLNDPKTIGDAVSALNKIVKDNGIKSRKVFLAIPDRSIFIRYVKLPPIIPSRIHLLVQYEAQQNVPYPLDDMVWDYHLFRSNFNSEDISVALVAAKKDWLHSLVGEMKASGYKVISAEPASVAMGNFLISEKMNMSIDIGSSSTTMVFIDSNNRMFSRSIPLGSKALTNDIMKETSYDREGAEEVKTKTYVAPPDGTEGICMNPNKTGADNVARVFATKLAIELTRTINFFITQQKGSLSGEILLTGGGSAIDGLSKFLTDKLHIKVVRLKDSLESVDKKRSWMGRDFLATSLTRKGLNDGEIVINLLNQRNGKIKKPGGRSKGVCDVCPFRKTK
jgi:type IV pilus assembly protein PilM